jgi:hypothetical protein
MFIAKNPVFVVTTNEMYLILKKKIKFVVMARNLFIFSVTLKREITSGSYNYMGRFSNALCILVRKLELKKQKAVSRLYNFYCSGHEGLRRSDILAPPSLKLGARWS